MLETETVVADVATDGDSSVNPDGIVRLAAGIGLSDLAVEASDCGQYVMLMCGNDLVALVGAMGSDVQGVEFAGGARYRVEELMDLVAV